MPCQGHPSSSCCCTPGDPCDYHAATCTVCVTEYYHVGPDGEKYGPFYSIEDAETSGPLHYQDFEE